MKFSFLQQDIIEHLIFKGSATVCEIANHLNSDCGTIEAELVTLQRQDVVSVSASDCDDEGAPRWRYPYPPSAFFAYTQKEGMRDGLQERINHVHA